MKKIMALLMMAALSSSASDSLFKPINDQGFGTVKLRAQTLSMYRDYEGLGNGYSTTLGWKLDYLSPEFGGLSAGVSYIHVDVLHAAGGAFGDNGEGLISNGNVNLMNELWLNYNFGVLGASNTFVTVGRQVLNGEVFRKDEFRQKPRAFEAALLTTKDIPNTSITLGHVKRMSNVWDNKDSWEFKDIGEVLGEDYDTDGVTWAEAVNSSITNLEVALFDAYAYDILNLIGGRAKYSITTNTAVLGYYRHESDVGRGADHQSDLFGVSIQQKIGGVTLEPGFISVSGDTLKFTEVGTGLNHSLGSSLMVYSGQFSGGADTVYLKAVTKINKTVLYALYNYTWHDQLAFDGQELDVVVKQAITDRFSVAFKGGVGYRSGNGGAGDTLATDARLFVTYNF